MQIVIEIPEEVKNRLCFGVTYTEDIQVVCKALNDGIPLPKGHDVLIDRGELKKIIQENDPLNMTGFSVRLCDIYRATPIIEKDGD